YISLEKKLEMAKEAGLFLRALNLKDTEVTDQQLKEVIEACPKLESLNLERCYNLTNDTIENLPKKLQSLNLTNNRILTDAAVKHLPKNLQSLDLTNCCQLTDAAIKNLPKKLQS